jgi:ATP-dependent Clp protease protease subunit
MIDSINSKANIALLAVLFSFFSSTAHAMDIADEEDKEQGSTKLVQDAKKNERATKADRTKESEIISDEEIEESFRSRSSFEKEDAALKAKRKEQYRLELENNLARLRLEQELMALRIEIEKLRVEKDIHSLRRELEQEEVSQQYQKALQELNQQRDLIMAGLSLAQAKFSEEMQEFTKQHARVQNDLMLARAVIDQLKLQIDAIKIQKEQALYAGGSPLYLDEPLQKDGRLVLSDRVIPLTGVIYQHKANRIVDLINYYNNKDAAKPIFLVIDSSPGGSAHAGFDILQAMKNSKAPVYVVVRSFAASMAALITTLAKKSYIYPNATLLHHQPWTSTWGNLRELKEDLEFMQQLWKRLGGEIAKKMHISLETLDKKLYEKSARGEWVEFGDNAVKLKWADHVISHIDNTGVREMPNDMDYTLRKYYQKYYDTAGGEPEKMNDKVLLLPLAGNDFYYLYNPHHTYQVAGASK